MLSLIFSLSLRIRYFFPPPPPTKHLPNNKERNTKREVNYTNETKIALECILKLRRNRYYLASREKTRNVHTISQVGMAFDMRASPSPPFNLGQVRRSQVDEICEITTFNTQKHFVQFQSLLHIISTTLSRSHHAQVTFL